MHVVPKAAGAVANETIRLQGIYGNTAGVRSARTVTADFADIVANTTGFEVKTETVRTRS